MLDILTEAEARVLGSLVEKQLTTPEYYPLTLNALTAACNQKSNRDPVVSFDETTIMTAVDSLRDKNLVYLYYGTGSRAVKYKHMMPEFLTSMRAVLRSSQYFCFEVRRPSASCESVLADCTNFPALAKCRKLSTD